MDTPSAAITNDELCALLSPGRPVEVALETWSAVAPTLAALEAHDTFIAGTLALYRAPCGVIAVEEPERSRRVARLFTSDADARSFVQDRLATYERMWNGCGCRIDYFR